MARVHQGIQIANHKVLSGRKEVAQQLHHHVIHYRRMKYLPDEGHEQEHERKKREDGIGGHGKCKRMYLRRNRYFTVELTRPE